MIGATASAGMFGGVVGARVVVAAPFEVPRGAFLRDAWFYFFSVQFWCVTWSRVERCIRDTRLVLFCII